MDERERNRVYQRGYQAGRRNSWPEHLPPWPPHEILEAVMKGARELCDAVDGLQAVYEEDDPAMQPLQRAVEGFNEATTAMAEWCKTARADEYT